MVCRGCGKEHDRLLRCEVAAAINTAAINEIAINRTTLTSGRNEGEPAVSSPDSGARSQGGRRDAGERPGRTANRRSRESYNAYMRCYMRKRRGN